MAKNGQYGRIMDPIFAITFSTLAIIPRNNILKFEISSSNGLGESVFTVVAIAVASAGYTKVGLEN